MTATFGTAGALALIAIGGWLASPVLDRAFRAMFPRVASALAAAAVIGAAIVVGVVLVAPVLVAIAGGVVLLAFIIACGRVAIGRSRREPPGDRSPVAWTRDLAHRDAYQRRFAAYGPIFAASQFGRTVVCIEGIERGQRLLRDHRDALGPSPLPFTQQLHGGFLRYMSDDVHDRYGPLFRRAVSREVTEAGAAEAARATVEAMARIGTGAVDPRPMLATVVESSMVRALYGLDPGKPATGPFLVDVHRFSAQSIRHRANPAARAGLSKLRTATRSLLATDLAEPSVLRNLEALDADQPDDVAVDNLLFMLRIGAANTASLATWGVELLAATPELRRRLAAGESGIGRAIVEETLRLAQSEYLYRRVRHDLVFDDVRLRRGWLVRVCVAESHRDPDIFACPAHFTDRFLERRPPPSEFAPFGVDRHACNSAGLASAIAEAILTSIAAEPDIEWVASGDLRRDPRHWAHWRPGPGLALRRATSTDHDR